MLDLVFTNKPSLMNSSHSVPGISDHAMVVTDLDTHPKSVRKKTTDNLHIFQGRLGINKFRNWKTFKTCYFRAWSRGKSGGIMIKFKTKIFEIMDKSIPTKTVKEENQFHGLVTNHVEWLGEKPDFINMLKNPDSGRNINYFNDSVKKHLKKQKQTPKMMLLMLDFRKTTVNHFGDTLNQGSRTILGFHLWKKLGTLFSESKDKA